MSNMTIFQLPGTISASFPDVIITNGMIAVISIFACLICIYMVFFFGRKLSDTTYARPELVENAKKK